MRSTGAGCKPYPGVGAASPKGSRGQSPRIDREYLLGHYTDMYVARLLPLAFLAPDIVTSVLAGTQPVHLTTEMLTRRANLPLDWNEQRALLGFNGHLRVPTPEGCSDRSAS